MLTKLEVNGFKNLVEFEMDFGPYTCIAGPNGVGKSNIFDAIQFLSMLTECTINQAALQVRNPGEDTGDIADLFFNGGEERHKRLEFAAEMIVDREVTRMILAGRLKHRRLSYAMKWHSIMSGRRQLPGIWGGWSWRRRSYARLPLSRLRTI